MTTLALCAAGTVAQGANFPVWTYISDNFLQLMTVNILIAYFLATYCYVASFSVKKGNTDRRELAAGGHMGNMIYDWFIGRELNPRITLPLIGEIDIKEFMELRPGMLAWMLFDLAFIAKQYRNYGYVTDSIVLVTVMQSIYILDGLYMEPAILTTMDITQDGFGFMLAFGDLAWLPFLYSTQARYLATHPVHLGVVGLAILAGPLLVGFSIFRLSNSQKNSFRTNPNDPKLSHLKYIETKAGTRLLVSGWWGVSRHINYLGDWTQSWPYCMVTGVAGYTILSAGTGAEGAIKMADGRELVTGAARGWGMIFTYFYIVYFGVLLVHRQMRDDEKCERKYGEDWKRYCSIVRSKIVPGIY
jgi:delta14-sterol reductase